MLPVFAFASAGIPLTSGLGDAFGSRSELDAAARQYDQRGVPHGGVQDLGPAFKLFVLAFRDPSNIQLELAAPYT